MSIHPDIKAVSVKYDCSTQCIVVTLNNGTIFAIPYWLCQGLTEAIDRQLEDIEISPSGLGLHWNELDADLHVHGLLMGVYGTAKWMEQLKTAIESATP